ncbi:hypothetical protein E3N88_10097 [Mikania micrantha]|uniref:Uncharacterized protein n=1 Tax=Mikania micrantha TaxID=192012 RepID=A0A5N6PCB6_9ASTR|nr:hypothetical protein E3N88_10097 [Mikania micrantha]
MILFFFLRDTESSPRPVAQTQSASIRPPAAPPSAARRPASSFPADLRLRPCLPADLRLLVTADLCELELGNNPVPMEICSTASGIVWNHIQGFSNRNQQKPWDIHAPTYSPLDLVLYFEAFFLKYLSEMAFQSDPA